MQYRPSRESTRCGVPGELVPAVLGWLPLWLTLLSPSVALSAQGETAHQPSRILARIDGGVNDFSYFTRFAASAQGRVAIAQAQDGVVRTFSADGQPLASAGRKGSGPGEFRAMNNLWWTGDTLWIADYQAARLTALSSGGRLLSTTPIPASLASSSERPAIRSPRLLGRFPDGSFLIRGQSRGAPVPGLANDIVSLEYWIVKTRADGTVLREITKLGDDHCQRRAPQAEVRLLLCPQPITEVATDGSAIVSVTMRVSGVSTSSYSLVAISPTGDTLYRRSVPVPVVVVPRALRDSLAKEMAAASPAIRALTKDYRTPAFYPPVSTLVLASNGDIWVGLRKAPDADLREWQVYDRLGRTRAIAWLPSQSAPFAAEPRGMWTTLEREDGLEDIVLYARPQP